MYYVLHRPYGSDKPFLELPGFSRKQDALAAVKTLDSQKAETGERVGEIKLCIGNGRDRRTILHLGRGEMQRLTTIRKTENGSEYTDYKFGGGLITQVKVLRRLYEYEETGLTPEQIIQMKEELRNMKAERGIEK